MADASGWWARRLQSPTTAPTPPQNPNARFAPGAPPVQQAPQVQQPTGVTYDANGAQVPDDGFIATIANAATATGGSRQVKESSGTCPECGGGNYFAQRRTENGMPLRVEASPRCFDCGYPVVQAGSSRGGATSARNSGPSRKARQLPSNHAVTVVDGGGTYTYPAN